MSAADAVRDALDGFVERFLRAHAAAGAGDPRAVHDPRWPSPCTVGAPDARGWIKWRPALREREPDFHGWEHALGEPLNPALRVFYGRYYSDHLPARAEQGALTLIQVWNDQDFERLVANQLGHALAARRAHAPLTVFVGCTDEDDLNLGVVNATGEVVLERPGQRPLRTIAPDLAALVAGLEPVVADPGDG